MAYKLIGESPQKDRGDSGGMKNTNEVNGPLSGGIWEEILKNSLVVFLLRISLVAAIFLGLGTLAVFLVSGYILSDFVNGILIHASFMQDKAWLLNIILLGVSGSAAWIWTKSKIPFVSRNTWFIVFSIGIIMFVSGTYLNRDMHLWNAYACTDMPDGYPYKSTSSKGKYDGSPCIQANTKILVAALKSIQDGNFPSVWSPKTTEDLKEQIFNQAGKQIIYASKIMKDGKYQFYVGPGVGNSSTQSTLDFLIYATEEMRRHNLKYIVEEKNNSNQAKVRSLNTYINNLSQEIRSIEQEIASFPKERIAVMSGGLEIPAHMEVFETGPRVHTGLHKNTNKHIAVLQNEAGAFLQIFTRAEPSWIVLIERSKKIRFDKLGELNNTLLSKKQELANIKGAEEPNQPTITYSSSQNENKKDAEMATRIAKLNEERAKNMDIVNRASTLQNTESLAGDKNTLDLEKVKNLKVYLRVEFLNREPPKTEFIFLANISGESNRVSSAGPIKIVSEGCPSSYISIDDGPENQICNGYTWTINPGQVWKIRNDYSAIKSRNIKVETFN